MATLTLNLPDSIKALAEARAAEAGFSDVEQFVRQLIVGEAAGAPEGLTLNTENDMEALVKSRIDGPFINMDDADFRQLRQKLQLRLSAARETRP